MQLAISTHWNAARHTSGEAMIEEILGLGLQRVELGYNLRMDLVPGVQRMVSEGAVRVDSLHNYCPVPMGVPQGHPELFTFADPDDRVRAKAVEHTLRTVRFAAEIGAGVVVLHAGNVRMRNLSSKLCDLIRAEKQYTPRYDRIRWKMEHRRERRVRKQLPYLYACLEKILPVLEETHVALAIENLPTWEAIPTEVELLDLMRHFNTPRIRCWYDIGHGQIRENMGMINQDRWLEKLTPYLAGMHIHDVLPPAQDHVLPAAGQVDFTRFLVWAQRSEILKVLEPSRQIPAEALPLGIEALRKAWGSSSLN